MAYTYTEPAGGVFADAISEVRYLVGDTAPAAPYSLTDAEIQYELAAVSGNRRLAAANVAARMGGKYTSSATTSKSVGNLSISKSYSDMATRYYSLASNLRAGADNGAVGGPIFTSGGDTGTEPQFYLGMSDYDG